MRCAVRQGIGHAPDSASSQRTIPASSQRTTRSGRRSRTVPGDGAMARLGAGARVRGLGSGRGRPHASRHLVERRREPRANGCDRPLHRRRAALSAASAVRGSARRRRRRARPDHPRRRSRLLHGFDVPRPGARLLGGGVAAGRASRGDRLRGRLGCRRAGLHPRARRPADRADLAQLSAHGCLRDLGGRSAAFGASASRRGARASGARNTRSGRWTTSGAGSRASCTT